MPMPADDYEMLLLIASILGLAMAVALLWARQIVLVREIDALRRQLFRHGHTVIIAPVDWDSLNEQSAAAADQSPPNPKIFDGDDDDADFWKKGKSNPYREGEV